MLVHLAAAALVLALIAYFLSGGADFGGGVWDLLASGPRARQQRQLIERALAPIWEANHVWLIVAVVVLFSCFPVGYAVVSTALHIPLTLLLIGIVLRGSAFVFRHYGMEDAAGRRRWSRVFAGASIVTPVMLGVVAGALVTGEIRTVGGLVTSGFFAGWTGPFAGLVGLLALALCAQLAAVYLAVEAQGPLRADFVRRGVFASGVALLLAVGCAFAARQGAPQLWEVLSASFGARLGLPLGFGAGVATVLCLVSGRVYAARIAVIAEVTLILGGWADGVHPYVVLPDLTLEAAAAPPEVLFACLVVLGVGSLLLLPALAWLFWVFKR